MNKNQLYHKERKKNIYLKAKIWRDYYKLKGALMRMQIENKTIEEQLKAEQQKNIEIFALYEEKIQKLTEIVDSLPNRGLEENSNPNKPVRRVRWRFDDLEVETKALQSESERVIQHLQDPIHIRKQFIDYNQYRYMNTKENMSIHSTKVDKPQKQYKKEIILNTQHISFDIPPNELDGDITSPLQSSYEEEDNTENDNNIDDFQEESGHTFSADELPPDLRTPLVKHSSSKGSANSLKENSKENSIENNSQIEVNSHNSINKSVNSKSADLSLDNIQNSPKNQSKSNSQISLSGGKSLSKSSSQINSNSKNSGVKSPENSQIKSIEKISPIQSSNEKSLNKSGNKSQIKSENSAVKTSPKNNPNSVPEVENLQSQHGSSISKSIKGSVFDDDEPLDLSSPPNIQDTPDSSPNSGDKLTRTPSTDGEISPITSSSPPSNVSQSTNKTNSNILAEDHEIVNGRDISFNPKPISMGDFDKTESASENKSIEQIQPKKQEKVEQIETKTTPKNTNSFTGTLPFQNKTPSFNITPGSTSSPQMLPESSSTVPSFMKDSSSIPGTPNTLSSTPTFMQSKSPTPNNTPTDKQKEEKKKTPEQNKVEVTSSTPLPNKSHNASSSTPLPEKEKKFAATPIIGEKSVSTPKFILETPGNSVYRSNTEPDFSQSDGNGLSRESTIPDFMKSDVTPAGTPKISRESTVPDFMKSESPQSQEANSPNNTASTSINMPSYSNMDFTQQSNYSVGVSSFSSKENKNDLSLSKSRGIYENPLFTNLGVGELRNNYGHFELATSSSGFASSLM
ncbi:hypothetical protein TVAG_392360 [Trichomonas vaginalis G3]|uniref:Uncharacterized protein n=1 Tax=Trichomonas vaginalis (strain ATCC PRA-98 / G3) TaxID=412133 RepID=A2DWT7_TRIV3|nr:hypothetical protein TVAGG3_0839510 [Trichomonas vaginalis G3]EAY15119.1 hypothetical protein TVAG_392360 [Trichomonas vaginalis G3]KAI5499189.1 hypothetical protein TVAGG3_0839510 [Trichomonas vaginalis G3]|eukprot:XP_001327342.1 hypothetical protein [Trichomonas vaginalis G3]